MAGGKIEKHVNNIITRDGAVLSVVIDPVDYKSEKAALATAAAAAGAGADIIAVGGSIGAQGEMLDSVVRSIKEKVHVPIVLFPGNIATVSRHADAIYFMTLLNSRNPYWISQAQTLAAPLIKQLALEALPVGYIVVEPGGTVGWVGDANVVPRSKPKIAASLALAGELSGHRIIFTDAGSAAFAPVPVEMVTEISAQISVPYLVAGGIRTPRQAADIIRAGADWVQIGTAVQNSTNAAGKVKEFVKAIKAAGRAKF